MEESSPRLLLREGQTVHTGDLLLKVDPTRTAYSCAKTGRNTLPLLAKAARL